MCSPVLPVVVRVRGELLEQQPVQLGPVCVASTLTAATLPFTFAALATHTALATARAAALATAALAAALAAAMFTVTAHRRGCESWASSSRLRAGIGWCLPLCRLPHGLLAVPRRHHSPDARRDC